MDYTEDYIVKNLQDKVRTELYQDIIPFWTNKVLDKENGGFVGRMSNNLQIEKNAPKGLILNTRLLWTYSALIRFDQQEIFIELANRAYNYLHEYFLDKKYGGAFWLLAPNGSPVDDKKKIYGHAFFVYALAEYYLATRNADALELAIEFYHIVVSKGHDNDNKGYYETFNQDWSDASDVRLSDIDMNEKKSMNTHLHVLEAFTNLYRVWQDQALEKKLQDLIDIFLNHIIDDNRKRFKLFFDEDWNSKCNRISYGHDIEGSWLLMEAAEVLGRDNIIQKIKPLSVEMARRVLLEGLDTDGAVFNEADPDGIIDSDKHWWPQVEAVVGFINAWQNSGEKFYLEAAYKCWLFIEENIIDHENGEWFWKVNRRGKVDEHDPKVSEWKSAYHNTRACIGILQRLSK
jgi:cellobiose epimerase